MRDRMELDVMRAFVKLLADGEKIVVTARDKSRTLKVAKPARHVRDAYQTTGYYLGLTGYGTHYTLCVPDSADEAARLRYPQNPGIGERVYSLDRDTKRSQNPATDAKNGVTGSDIVSDTTAADLIDSGPEGDFR